MSFEIPKSYKTKTIPQLLEITKTWCHRVVRQRDDLGGYYLCISCGKRHRIRYNDNGEIADTNYHAGHYIHGSTCSALRFELTNIHGQCKSQNYFGSGSLIDYRPRLIERVGIKEVERLERIHAYWKGKPFKWDRFSLIEKIFTFKEMYNQNKSGFVL